jgi:UDP-glucose 4-epimerase
MAKHRIVLVTGVSGTWGARVAEKLLDNPELQVIGLDSEAPEQEIKDLDFIQADIRNPLLVDLFKEESIDTVVHLAHLESLRPTEAAFDFNVMGTMRVFGASAEAGVRKVVFKSSTMVYGAFPDNSAYLPEEQSLKGSRTYGYTRDLVEIEAFLNGFSRQVPTMIQTILRFANIVGPDAETPMTRFLQEPIAPVLLGFDPMMQVIHEVDVVDALVHAVQQDVPGVFNVAAEGVMPLSKLMGLAGKLGIPVFHLFMYWGSELLDSAGIRMNRVLPLELDYLRYPWVGDLERMRSELGFMPRYTAEEALREFAGKQRLQRYLPDSKALAYDEERLRDTIERRRRARERRQRTASIEPMLEEEGSNE